MSVKFITESILTAIADAIRAKDETTAPIEPVDMAQRITDLPGGNPDLEALITGTATGDITIPGLTTLGATLVFDATVNVNSGVTSLSLPDLITVPGADPYQSGITGYNGALRRIDIPNCTRFKVNYYNGNNTTTPFPNLEVFNAPKLQSLYGTLRGSKLTTLDLPKLNVAGASMFEACSQLTSVNLPILPIIYSRMFATCSALTEIELPEATFNYAAYAFAYCSSLESIKLPKCIPSAYGSSYLCYQSSALELADFGSSTIRGGGFGNYVFMDCSALKALVLRHSSINSLSNTNAFTNTPIASGTGYIYVPRDLIPTYEAATNWSVYAGQFRALEDYTDDGTLDGTFIMPSN